MISDRIGTRSPVATKGKGRGNTLSRTGQGVTSPKATEVRRVMPRIIPIRITESGTIDPRIIKERRVRSGPLNPTEMPGNR